jgi:multiple sugar transport system ATP-binding protein
MERIALDDQTLSARPALQQYEGRPLVLGIRPEDLDDASLVSDASGDRTLKGQVELREALGPEIMVHFSVDAKPALTEDVRELAQDAGTADATLQQTGELWKLASLAFCLIRSQLSWSVMPDLLRAVSSG